MKLTKIADTYLLHMLEHYKQSNNRFIDWDDLLSLFDNVSKQKSKDALIVLSDNDLIDIFWASNEPYTIQININTIIEAEQDSYLKRLLPALEMITKLFP